DVLLNSLLVRTASTGRAHRVSVANAGYGVGSVIGPILVILARPSHYPLLLAAVGLGALALTVSTRGVRAPVLTASYQRVADPRRRAKLTTFVLAYVLYVATEASLSAWIAPQVHRIGFSEAVGAADTAGFWLGLAVGRFAAGPAHRMASPRRLVLVGLATTVTLCLLARADVLAPIVYPLSGISMALVYPMGLIWFIDLSPRDNDGLALMILLMMAGGVIGPALTSVAVSVGGIRMVPFSAATWALADLVVFASARRFAPLESVGGRSAGTPPRR
ncbi:MAG: MFS transporter, partial [Solirubrobacteraceae bacterium]